MKKCLTELKSNEYTYRFVFGAGGTGGHLFPALAVAQKIREIQPEAKIVFLGNRNKIEGRAVAANGFDFKPIIVSGFHRGEVLRNILFPFKLLIGMLQSLAINMKFKPRVAIGSGAYVAGPVIWAASVMGAKILLLEQNSYPGITNRLLERKATDIFTAFEETKKYFRFPEKVKKVGNPIRINIATIPKSEAKEKLGLSANSKVLLVIGGSLGARSLNEAVANNIEELKKFGLTVLWQTGKAYYENYKKFDSENVRVIDFIDDVAVYYSAADLVIARAGATTIAELAHVGVAAVLVPSPNVAENHQFKNAEELRKNGAVELIEDGELAEKFLPKVRELIENESHLNELKENIKKFASKDAAEIIARRAIELAEKV